VDAYGNAVCNTDVDTYSNMDAHADTDAHVHPN
jgi:hypothetical protein